jgi:LAO/AO transport system kinase
MTERFQRLLKGDIQAAAKMITDIENDPLRIIDELKELYRSAKTAYVVGITGAPGTGKSTLVGKMIEALRKEELKVGVVAVDPTSPFSQGALLGDRIRMQKYWNDDGVFIRSLASRGHFGGVSKSTADVVRVMGAMGKDIVIIETVGVGQDEIEIVNMADTTLVVVIPGMGDEIQLMKAGIAEIGDILVVNKADHEGADRAVLDLEIMLRGRRRKEDENAWDPLVCKTVATQGTGLDELIRAIHAHQDHPEKSKVAEKTQEGRVRYEVAQIARSYALEVAEKKIKNAGGFDELVKEILRNGTDPYTVVEKILKNGQQEK